MRSVFWEGRHFFCCLIFLLEEEGLSPAPALVNRWVLPVLTAAPGSAMGYAIKWSHVSSSWEVFADEVEVVGIPPQLSTVKATRPFQLRGWDCNVLESSEFSLMSRGLRCNVRCSTTGILEALSRGRNESISYLLCLPSVSCCAEASLNCALKIIKSAYPWDKVISNFDKIPRQSCRSTPSCEFSQSKH